MFCQEALIKQHYCLVDVDDDDLEETSADDAHREEEGAMDRAANMFDCKFP